MILAIWWETSATMSINSNQYDEHLLNMKAFNIPADLKLLSLHYLLPVEST